MSILALLLGRQLCDRYRVDSVIATGGMGAVCRAFDLKLERQVAVKVITAAAPDEDQAGMLRARFHREARAAARLRHPNVVTVHDFGTDPGMGIDFLVMELLAGEDLAARMRRAGGPLAVEEGVEILREAGMGLAAGHRAGMVHRDVKPANIYLVAEPGGWEVKLLDFGIAQLRAEATGDTPVRLTRFGVPHTPRYASPEQLGHAPVTPASDVFSLALAGVEMLSGSYPEGLNTTADDRAAARCVRRLLQARPEVPLRLAAVLRRSLRLDPQQRFADAGALLDALASWDAAPPSAAVAAQGYASILPQRPGAPPPPPPADDEHTALAPAFVAAGAPAWAPRPAGPPPVPQPAAAPGAPVAGQSTEPAQAPDEAPRKRRRLRLRPAGWLVLLLVLAAAAAWWVLREARTRGGRPNLEPSFAQPRPEPPGGPELAREEYRRVSAGSAFGEGDTAYVIIIASLTPDQLPLARSLLERVRGKGYDVGLANSQVYPQLRDGFVVLVSRPYATHEGAEEALPDLQAEAAPDAFVKRVTLRRPR